MAITTGVKGVSRATENTRETLRKFCVRARRTGGSAVVRSGVHTTNPARFMGLQDDFALAARTGGGSSLSISEFMQFHPTAVDAGRDPMPLASEALRGEGAVLVDETGDAFHGRFSKGRAELEPRDIVARAISCSYEQGPPRLSRCARGDRREFRDTLSHSFAARLHFACRYRSRRTTPIPMCAPPRIIHMGGVVKDSYGRARAAARSMVSGPAARSRRRGCTAPIASPAIPCSKPRFSARGSR